MEVRVASIQDAEAILAIYAPYVEKTNITFEYDVPSLAQMQRRIMTTLEKYPYLVLIDQGKLVGYAYAGSFASRQAYDWDCELSIYVDSHTHGRSYGQILYQHLIAILKMMNIQNVYACITHPNEKSEKFHELQGFSYVGCFHACGYKFNQWHDMVWMEKHIGNSNMVLPVIPFSKIPSIQIESTLQNEYVQSKKIMI